MKWLWLLPFILTLGMLFENDVAAQSQSTGFENIGLTYGTLTVQSTPESSHVMFDGKSVGSTPLAIDSVAPGIHALTLQHPDVEDWLTDPTTDTVIIAEGEHKTLRYHLRTRYLITSTPFGADVVLGDSIVGTTPFLASMAMGEQALMLRKPGYEPSTVHTDGRNVVAIPLAKLWPNDGNSDTYFREPEGGSNKTLALVGSGTATVLSGVVAAYLKTKADNHYQQYLLTGDSYHLSQTHLLDTSAGIALIATQVGLGLFTYILFSE